MIFQVVNKNRNHKKHLKMYNIPINHKTIFVLDHSNYFASSCGQSIDIDTSFKLKSTPAIPNLDINSQSLKLNPIIKSLWTCNVEAVLEYSRIVFDLFPEQEKLIRLMVTKVDMPLNSWSENDLDHVNIPDFFNEFLSHFL